MQFKDYYDTLGVDPGAGETEIKTAYRRLARKYHPDVSKEAGAEEKFKAVNEAYEALRDPARCESTILDLAMASGFNSKSALNRVFKAHAGMTPGEFRRQEQALPSA